MISESTRFLAQPRETRLTLSMDGKVRVAAEAANEKTAAGRPRLEREKSRVRAYFFLAASLMRSFLRLR